MELRENIFGLIKALIISLGVIIGSCILSNSFTEERNDAPSIEKKVLTIEDLSEYLSVTKKDLEKIIEKEEIKKASIEDGAYDIYIYIPYLEIAGEKRFLKSEINKWLLYQSNFNSNN